jgi:uncharacterized membrane protein
MPTPQQEPDVRVLSVGWNAPLRWLALGWADLRRAPLPGLLHGLASAAFGALLFWLAGDLFWVLAGAFSGFLLVAPIVATGLYAISRRLEAGQPAVLSDCWAVWRSHDSRLVHFGVLLAFAGTGWVVTSASFVTSFVGAPVSSPLDFLRMVVLAPQGWLFEIWLVLGALLAAPIFASSVVAIPLLLERRVSVLRAVLTSWQAVGTSPGPLALWAGVIMGLTLLGMLTALIGLVVAVPWLAHASWHAYRDLVERP